MAPVRAWRASCTFADSRAASHIPSLIRHSPGVGAATIWLGRIAPRCHNVCTKRVTRSGSRRRTLAFALLAWSVLSDCASTLPVAAEQPAERPRSATAALATPKSRANACPNVRQAERTFVGFATDQTLDDFEATARHATRVLRLLKTQLCRLGAEQDRAGKLRAALDAGGGEIRSVHFSSGELLLADVGVQVGERAGAESDDAGRTWVVHVQRTGEAWRVLSAAPK
jgi:hypothetical protein